MLLEHHKGWVRLLGLSSRRSLLPIPSLVFPPFGPTIRNPRTLPFRGQQSISRQEAAWRKKKTSCAQMMTPIQQWMHEEASVTLIFVASSQGVGGTLHRKLHAERKSYCLPLKHISCRKSVPKACQRGWSGCGEKDSETVRRRVKKRGM